MVEPIDVTAVVAVFMGTLTVLIPIAGLTMRFALKPVVESLSRWSEGRQSREDVEILNRRVALLEQQIENLEGSVRRFAEAADFDRQLAGGRTTAASLPEPRSAQR
ncbi:MAG: hypothetical protein HY701_13230 [Gemmatimonadetes bacterium]|nr:hypothetical protein [Gemmatimonadota bacterium]